MRRGRCWAHEAKEELVRPKHGWRPIEDPGESYNEKGDALDNQGRRKATQAKTWVVAYWRPWRGLE
eukprot:scaffold16227_cov14-Tisochrysis_lutea.AAC.1